MDSEKSKTIVYPNGDVLNSDKVADALYKYWQFTKAEKRAFDRMKDRADLKEKYLDEVKNKE